MKLQEEEHQRKLVQDKASQVRWLKTEFSATLACNNDWQVEMFLISKNKKMSVLYCIIYGLGKLYFLSQLQTGLEANRILLQSVSPYLSSRQSKEKKSNSKVKTVTELVSFASI